ncbi:substrate-binding domain-containing protein [Shewanella litorisediminis]|uniref:Substrate-binding domain-containing protein n=1 Tax=Shewanella litorisediminis TaxID=1173586 RepID=A0ABX7G8D0_9GAMM|nr:substrate-binding domain-containing protein [Shewanella litorisediminis]MCL2919350.1 substrate-binding domain-containing protein [Shewanella litorisediminis]QRH03483.1 substrate-binding domain-containing protein [Shewanella litorisediminis]
MNQADSLEHDAISQKAKIQSSLKMAVDTLFPRPILGQILNELNTLFPELNIQLHETTLSRCAELLEDGTVDVGIASLIPRGYTGRLATTIELYAVAHLSHPLLQQKDLQLKALEPYKQIVIRDGGFRSNTNSGWLGSTSRITVSSLSEAVSCVKQQLGFAWLPFWVLQLPENKDLAQLPLQNGLIRTVALQTVVRQTETEDHFIKELGRVMDNFIVKLNKYQSRCE